MSWGYRGDSSRASRLPQPPAVPRAPRPAVLVGLAHTLCDTGRTAEAEELCRWVLAADPGFHGAQIGLGRALLEEGRLEESIEILRAAVHAFPGSFAGYRWLGEALVRKGDWPRARAILAQGALISPDNRRIAQLLQLAGEARPTRKGYAARPARQPLPGDPFGAADTTPVTSPGATRPGSRQPAPPPIPGSERPATDDDQVKITGEFGPGSGPTPQVEPLERPPRKPVALVLLLAALVGLGCGALIVRVMRGRWRPPTPVAVQPTAPARAQPTVTPSPPTGTVPAALADGSLVPWLDLVRSQSRSPDDRPFVALASALLATEYGVPLDAAALAAIDAKTDGPRAELAATARALAPLASGDVPAAVAATRALAAGNSPSVLARFARARALARAGDSAGAQAALAAAPAQDIATFTPALMLRAELALDAGRPAEARETLEAVVASRRGSPRAELLLEEVRRALGVVTPAGTLEAACAHAPRALGVRLSCRTFEASDRRRAGDARGAAAAVSPLGTQALRELVDARPLAQAATVLANLGDPAGEAFAARARRLSDRKAPTVAWADAALALAAGTVPATPAAPPVGPEQRMAAARLARAADGDRGLRTTLLAWSAGTPVASGVDPMDAITATDADLRWFALLARTADGDPSARAKLAVQLLQRRPADVGPSASFVAGLLAGSRRHLALTWFGRAIGGGPHSSADVCFAAERYVSVASALGKTARRQAESSPAFAAARTRCPEIRGGKQASPR